jgi:methanogenic corrinoid protein MtbC1
MSAENILEKLRLAVLDYNSEEAVSAAKEVIKFKVDPLRAIEEGLAKGIREVGEKFANGEVFLPELIMAAETMKKALEVLEPELKRERKERKTLWKSAFRHSGRGHSQHRENHSCFHVNRKRI